MKNIKKISLLVAQVTRFKIVPLEFNVRYVEIISYILPIQELYGKTKAEM